MSLASDLRKLRSGARVLTFDIETQRAIVETFTLWPKFISMDRVIVPARVLCFSAQWRGEDKIIFRAAWNEDVSHNVNEEQYRKMLQTIWDLLDRANVVVTYNGDRFDLGWIEGECARLGMGRPSSYKSVDLYKTAKRKFGPSLMSKKLEWSARHWLKDGKVQHEGRDLWHDIRWGTKPERKAAKELMREYCCHDTVLTEHLFDYYLPWINVNLALHQPVDDGQMYCTKCGGTEVNRVGFHYTNCYAYPEYRCAECGSPSRDKRSIGGTTPLRIIA